MKILVTGGGGREHAIVKKLLESKSRPTVFCAPGNGGISRDVECFPDVKATDIDGQAALAKKLGVDLVVIGPDDALANGLADKLATFGIPAFGPNKLAARLESSKVFSKGLMKKYGIPTADYAVFDDPQKAKNYINSQEKYPIVVKADGLALGKGVIIAEDKSAALAAITEIMEDKKFGASGSEIVIEEFLTGPEMSVFVITDGQSALELSSAMDHKRANDGDEGLNTGGMGVIAPNPYYTDSIKKEVREKIIAPTITAMQSEGCPFVGCIYFGLMATPGGVKVIEYNSRFGDPEAQAILPLFDGDFASLTMATTTGRLGDYLDSEIQKSGDNPPEKSTNNKDDENYKFAACVVLASGGYPVKYETGKPIAGLAENGGLKNPPVGDKDSITVFHAGTKYTDSIFYTAGGRVLGVTALGNSLADAIEKAYLAAKEITFENMHFRTDIGAKALKAH